MRKLLLLIILALCSFAAQAQNVQHEDDSHIAFERARIGIDYSMPDFSTKRIDGDTIGNNLADMLDYLKSNYSSGVCKNRLMSIVSEDVVFIIPPQIKSFKIQEINKVGDVITIETKMTFTKNEERIKELNVPFVFDRGISPSSSVNSLFKSLNRAVHDK